MGKKEFYIEMRLACKEWLHFEIIETVAMASIKSIKSIKSNEWNE